MATPREPTDPNALPAPVPQPATPAPTSAPAAGGLGGNLGGFVQGAGQYLTSGGTQGKFAPQGAPPDLSTGLGTNLPGTGTTGMSPEQLLAAQMAWTNPIAEFYLGRQLSYRELLEVQKRGFNHEQLVEQIRSRPSYLPGLTIGQVEDYHTNSKQPFMDWLGRQATDEDIRDLHNRGIMDQDKIDEYVRNRDDVVALHPGAPLNLKDEQYGLQKNAIDSDYLQNLGRTSTHEEARSGIQGKAKGPAPKQSFDVTPEYGQEPGGGLESKTLIAPNARNFA